MKRRCCKFGLLLGVVFAATGFYSCDTISGVDLTNAVSVEKMLPARLEKHIDPEAAVFTIRFGTTSDFSVSMDVASVDFIAPGAAAATNYAITIPGNQPPREGRVIEAPRYDPLTGGLVSRKLTPENGVRLREVDFSQIASNIAKGVAIMAERKMTLDGIETYTITLTPDPPRVAHTFRLTNKAGTELGAKNGRAAPITEYYEFDFIADAQGNVVLNEE
ncbi:MAG: hypothetical protein LBU80_03010 [Rikenellaceae bacterium]|jgi:hypothetical protein|nr:hypothetical protein [Rikenellaceae bacterium]